ncbi:hypothetical protein [Roseovarius salis]|uniref:hypothetical protein n=1 Tax=Roseovarius salis TaxID=3376063 RepID=UPI0037C8E5AF
MPNTLAYLMLMAWPVVCLILFRRLCLERAIIWSLLGGYLLLPPRAEFDFPLVPDFDKTSIPSLCALAFCLLIARRSLPVWPDSRVMRVLLFLFVAGAVPTVLTNSDPIVFGAESVGPVSQQSGRLPGLRVIDVLSVISGKIITIIPFLLGRAFLSSDRGLRELLLALAVGGLAYSLPALVEVRLSPQLNTWIYGFFQHNFAQMMREEGFRPLVFLPHALWLAFFLMTAAVSSAVLARCSDGVMRGRFLAATVYLLFVLVLCKSLAPMLYAMTLVPLLLFSGPRLQVRLAVLFAFVAVLYPVLRDHDLVPLEAILGWADAINPDRAQSLGFRFENEEQLLERAEEKRLFGWGGWGRNLVRDPGTGEIVSIPDGEWIIAFGTYGWVGYASLMGLLAGPVVILWRRMAPNAVSRHVAALALILAITMVDMLINAILTPYTWLIAGALLGYCERDRRADTAAARAPRRRQHAI